VKLLIAIPALNEEESIESIIERTLASREAILRNSPVTEVEITVVSDGSTDRTVERASKFLGEIHLIEFPKNRGYGAALKEAWRQSDADLLGFLDADGTCDPTFFGDLCQTIHTKSADVALGCRLNAKSQMPVIRRAGNMGFAMLLNLVSSKRVRDTASGMRVVRREVLDKLYPLPDGMHFTPAMSARAMLNRNITIIEVDMPYHERTGESKLRVVKDGLRFLRVILEMAFLHRPSRPLELLAYLFAGAAALLMIEPAAYYVQTRTVAEWMIYRFVVTQLLGTLSMLFLSAAYLTMRMAGISLGEGAYEIHPRWYSRLFRGSVLWTSVAGLYAVAIALVWQGFVELISSGSIYEHWSRFVVSSFFASVAFVLLVTKAIDFVLELTEAHLLYLRTPREPASRPSATVARR